MIADTAQGKYRPAWDVVMVVTLLYSAIVTPYEIAFSSAVQSIDGLFILNRIVDALFFAVSTHASRMVFVMIAPRSFTALAPPCTLHGFDM